MTPRRRRERSYARGGRQIPPGGVCVREVYYDLFEEREKRGINDVYLLRCRASSILPAQSPHLGFGAVQSGGRLLVQEEPKNMGAWSFVDPYLEWVLASGWQKQAAAYAGRPAAASPRPGCYRSMWRKCWLSWTMFSRHERRALTFR